MDNKILYPILQKVPQLPSSLIEIASEHSKSLTKIVSINLE